MRRDTCCGCGVRFGAGAGGELAVTWPALLAADRIAVAPGVRVTARGADRGEGGDPLSHYESVFAFIAAHPELPDARRRVVLPAMLRHELARLRRMPEPERPDVLRGARGRAGARHRRGDERLRGRAEALQARVIERGDYRAFRALDAALRTAADAGTARAAG